MPEKPTYKDLEERVKSLEKERAELDRMTGLLLDSEHKYRTFFENSMDALFISKPDGLVLEANAAACEMFGYTEEELIRLGRNAVTDPDDARLRSALRERDREGRFAGELNLKRKDGTRFPAEITSVIFKTGNGDERASIIVRDITERKKAEEAMRERETFIRAVMDHLPIGLAVNSVDPAVDFVYMNDNFPRFYRTTREGLADPDAFWDIVYEDPVFREEIRQRVLEDCAGNDPERMHWEDVPIARKGEETVFINARNTPVPEKSLMISTVWDVTDRKRADDALRESEARYRTIFDHGADGIVIIDPDTAVPVDFNNQACAQLGYSREEFGRLKISEIDLLEGPEDIAARIKKVIDTGYDEFETIHRTKQGERRDVHVKAQYIQYKGKSLYHCIWRDITESRRSEETARREVALRNILLDNMPCAAVVLKKHTREIVACNDLAKKYGAVVGRVCHDVMAVPGTPCPFCQAPEVWEKGKGCQVEAEYMGKFWLGIWVPFSDDLYVHYIFDVTDRKRSEAEKENLLKQLLAAQRMEAVGTLAGGIAHDFNNALMGIMGFTEVLIDSFPGDEQALSDLNEIMRCAERASMLTRQLLTYARRQIIEPIDLSLNQVIADLMKLVSKVVGEQIEVRTSLAEDLPAIHADVGQIEQVVMNLVLNARDAMPGGGRLAVETGVARLDTEYCRSHPDVKPGAHVVLTVSDTGIGMDKHIEERAFEPFFTTKRPDQGTGLGLSMVYGIVKQHNGSIHLHSEPGKGTTFRIYLPAIAGSADAVVSARPSEIRGGTETVLLAEDDESVRRLVVRTLTELGYTVLVARDGEEAVETFRKSGDKIDLALLDVVMPRKGGKDACGDMRKLKADLKVIFMSGYTTDAVHDSFVLNPGVSFLSKPFSPGAMARKIREVLDGPCR